MQLTTFAHHKNETLRGLFSPASSTVGVLCVHGFERTSLEAKFKHIEQALRGQVNIFRFDFSGCGVSDGNFEDGTIEKWSKELGSAIEQFRVLAPAVTSLRVVAHSVGGCIVAAYAAEHAGVFDRIVLYAPAFNQRELQRYWFVMANTRDQEITWENYRDFLDEEKFQKDMQRKKRMMKAHWIGDAYYMENKEKDYQPILAGIDPDRTLIIHGDADKSVPRESNNSLPNGIIVRGVKSGDHDLERPDMVEQYSEPCINFLLS